MKAQHTVLATDATAVALPLMSSNIVFQNNGSVALRYALGGSVPTATEGIRLLAGDVLQFSGEPAYRLRGTVSFIAESGSAVLDVTSDTP